MMLRSLGPQGIVLSKNGLTCLEISAGQLAISEKEDVVGYIAVRQFTSDKGKEIQLGLAPLYANSDQIAKSLLKKAAEAYLSNDATSKSKIDLFYSDGGSSGHHASQLMQELEATAFHIG